MIQQSVSTTLQLSDEAVEEVMVLMILSAENLLVALGMGEIVSVVGELFCRVERSRHKGAFIVGWEEALCIGAVAWCELIQRLSLNSGKSVVELNRFQIGNPRDNIPVLARIVAERLELVAESTRCLLVTAMIIQEGTITPVVQRYISQERR